MEIFDCKKIFDLYLSEGFAECKNIKIVGCIKSDISFELRNNCFDVVDLSEAEFIEEDKEERVCLGFSHSGPVYSSRICTRHYDYLEMFVSDIYTKKIILPPNVKRKHMNRIKDRSFIETVIVHDECPLFSMKDGDVYNKKGTTLVFSNKK